ncbi:Transmembrane prolyl 4-hydroxylase, partial [Exaiptasia diaphana]
MEYNTFYEYITLRVISVEEFKKVTVPAITGYFDKLREVPHLRSRNSEQAWMFHDNPKYPLLADFHGRIHRLTGLPKHMIRHSEPVQVVKYDVRGHYHAHTDSDELNDTLPCCTLNREENCRLC